MPAQKNPRNRSRRGPQANNANSKIGSRTVILKRIFNKSGGQVKEGGEEANPRGVAAREGPMIGGEHDAHHALVVHGAGPAHEVLHDSDECEVKDATEEEGGDDVAEREEEKGGEGDREEEAAVAGEFEESEEESGD